MAGYTYNPAASIKQSFTEAKADMGDIFAQVLQRQQRDYAVAENTFANIEALKKDLNIYGQKSITQKANALLGNASQAILQNGKIDYTKMGEIRQAVSDIKDLKTGYALGGQEFDKWVQMGLANKDNLNSFEMYYKDLMAKMSDENLIKNPRDLQVALSDTYTNNLDAVKMIGTSYLKSNPLYKVKPTDVIDPKTKAMVRVEGEMAAGWKPDGKGGLIEPDPVIITNPDGTQTTVTWKQQALAQVNATNPQAIPALRKQYGYSAKGMSDEDLLAYAVRKIPMQSSAVQVKSAAAIQTEEAQAKTSTSTANVADELNRLNLQGKRLSNTGQVLQNTGQNLENQAKQLTLDSFKLEGQQAGTENEIFFSNPKSLVMPIGKASSDVIGKSQKISFDPKTGQIFVSALKSNKNGFNVGENTTDITGVQAVPIPRNKLAAFKKSVLTSALTGIEKDQKPLVRKQVESIFKKAELGSVSDKYLTLLTPANKLPNTAKRIPLSKLREAYSAGAYNSIDEAIQDALTKGIPVTRN